MASKARGLADLGNAFSDGALSNRNLIINGAMQVAQRGTSATGVTGNGYYVCDRFTQEFEASGTWTLTQSTDAPSGFRNSAKWECTASTAQGITTYALVEQRLEKQNLAHLQYGTADAKDVTLSFWVKSNKTGDYNCNIIVVNSTNPQRMIASKYTIISANTWEYKTITFEGDTSSDLLIEESNHHVQIEWWLGGGTTFTGNSGIGLGWQDKDNTKRANETVNLADTIGNYWQITGVQLEVGDTATPFEHRSYGQELALCQRYFERVVATAQMWSHADIGGNHRLALMFKERKRSSPTIASSGWSINTPTEQAGDLDFAAFYTTAGFFRTISGTIISADAEL